MLIQSPQNPRVKHLIALREKKRLRNDERAFVVEGTRESVRALQCGFQLRELFHCAEVGGLDPLLRATVADGSYYEISQSVFDKLAVREGSDGVICVFNFKERDLSQLQLNADSICLVFEGMEKPGNLGAVLRSADGAGVSAVFIVGESVDIYNPNAIRASVGAVFSVPVFVLSYDQLAAFMKRQGVHAYVATPDGAQSYFEQSFASPCALVFGNEANGVSAYWLTNQYPRIKIPMHGIADSLNVSVSAGVLMYDVRRQLSSKR